MGKSRKKSARKAAAAPAVIPPVKIAKQEGKREAEGKAEKQVPKKQKKNDALELAVEMQKVEESIPKTVESISSPEKESVSEEEKAHIAQVVPLGAVKNCSVVAPEEKNKAASGSEEDPSNEHLDEDENAPSKNTSAVSIMETQLDDRSDGSDLFEGDGKSNADENKVQSAKEFAAKASIEKKMDVDTDDNEDGSDNNSEESDDEPQPQKITDSDVTTIKQAVVKSKETPKTLATTQGETKSKTLFVGNLSFNVEKTDVENFFKDAGNVLEIRFASDHEGRFKGYGHVEFETPEAAQKALELNGESLLNRNVRLDLARERGSYTPHDSGDRSSFQKGGRSQTIYVRGFDASLGEEEARNLLQEHFSACGEITRIALPKDFESGSSKGFAYIDFKDGDSFNQALELNGSELGDGQLTVEEAKPRAEGGSGRGNGRDRDGGSFRGNGRDRDGGSFRGNGRDREGGSFRGNGRGGRGGRGGGGRGRFGDSGGRFGGGRGNSGRGRGRGRGRGF